MLFLPRLRQNHFYPRPPRGGRPIPALNWSRRTLFLSTPSARRATAVLNRCKGLHHISIHALREEGDHQHPVRRLRLRRFLSTPSARRATGAQSVVGIGFGISIHALREEGDLCCDCIVPCKNDFYPRPPRGGRPKALIDRLLCHTISIHALREEGDRMTSQTISALYDFYPRPPRGGRRWPTPRTAEEVLFLSTPSARRATAANVTGGKAAGYFYPRPPRGGRLIRDRIGAILV